jgi:hypothetical protein
VSASFGDDGTFSFCDSRLSWFSDSPSSIWASFRSACFLLKRGTRNSIWRLFKPSKKNYGLVVCSLGLDEFRPEWVIVFTDTLTISSGFTGDTCGQLSRSSSEVERVHFRLSASAACTIWS